MHLKYQNCSLCSMPYTHYIIHSFFLVTSNNCINIKAQQIRQSQAMGHFVAPDLVTGQIVNYFTLRPDNSIIYYNSIITPARYRIVCF